MTGTVQWVWDTLYNIHRLYKGKERKRTSCLLDPSAKLEIWKGVREKIWQDWWKISLATLQVLTPMCAREDPQGAQGNLSCSEETQEAITLPQPNGTQAWGVIPLKWGQRMFLHWVQPTLLGSMLYGGFPNNQSGADGRSQHEHVQSSATQIFTHVNHLQVFLKCRLWFSRSGSGAPRWCHWH